MSYDTLFYSLHINSCHANTVVGDTFVHIQTDKLLRMNNDTVKKNLEAIRLSNKLSQEEMANALGITRNTYRNIEKGKTKLISETILKVAEWAEISPEEVVLGYAPVEDHDSVLKETREKLNGRIKMLTDEYEAKLEIQRTEIELLKELIKEKDDNIRSLKSWIAILEKKADA